MIESFTFFVLLCLSMFLASYFIGFLPLLLGNLGQVSSIGSPGNLFLEQDSFDKCFWSGFVDRDSVLCSGSRFVCGWLCNSWII